MKSLREIGYSIINPVSGFMTSDDQRIDPEWVYDKIWDVYAKLRVKYRKENGHLEPADYAQTCCLEVKCRHQKCDSDEEPPPNKTNDPSPPLQVESETLQYYVELPDIDWYGVEDPIVFFGSDGLKERYSYKSINGFENSDYETYISGKPIYTVVGNEAWLKNLPTSSQTKVCIVAVLASPGNKCNPDDIFPAPRAFIFELELLVKRDILSSWGINPDLINNANDLKPQPPQPQRQQPQEDTE